MTARLICVSPTISAAAAAAAVVLVNNRDHWQTGRT